MIRKLLERVYNLLDHFLYADTRLSLETTIEALELERDNLQDANEELMVTVEEWKEEANNLRSRRWA